MTFSPANPLPDLRSSRATPAINLERFNRYRPLLENWEKFQNVLMTPQPQSVWANPERITPAELMDRLAAQGIPSKLSPWHPWALRLEPDAQVGRTLEFANGLCHSQEETSLVPARLLQAQPHEKILDLCAAPGNKTVNAAIDMKNTGTLIANEPFAKRHGSLRNNIDRLGITNVIITQSDGTRFPKTYGLFDRVIADVPCSCEGTSRKNPRVLQPSAPKFLRNLYEIQRMILRKAVQLCKPGGRIVYSTCTYSPEENEINVSEILEEFSGELRVCPAQIPNFTTAPGITEWQGRSLHSEVANCLRIWPHLNNTGGFFIAVLEKRGSSDG